MDIKIDGIGIIVFVYLSKFNVFLDVIEEMNRFLSTNLCDLSVPCSQHTLIESNKRSWSDCKHPN